VESKKFLKLNYRGAEGADRIGVARGWAWGLGPTQREWKKFV